MPGRAVRRKRRRRPGHQRTGSRLPWRRYRFASRSGARRGGRFGRAYRWRGTAGLQQPSLNAFLLLVYFNLAQLGGLEGFGDKFLDVRAPVDDVHFSLLSSRTMFLTRWPRRPRRLPRDRRVGHPNARPVWCANRVRARRKRLNGAIGDFGNLQREKLHHKSRSERESTISGPRPVSSTALTKQRSCSPGWYSSIGTRSRLGGRPRSGRDQSPHRCAQNDVRRGRYRPHDP